MGSPTTALAGPRARDGFALSITKDACFMPPTCQMIAPLRQSIQTHITRSAHPLFVDVFMEELIKYGSGPVLTCSFKSKPFLTHVQVSAPSLASTNNVQTDGGSPSIFRNETNDMRWRGARKFCTKDMSIAVQHLMLRRVNVHVLCDSLP